MKKLLSAALITNAFLVGSGFANSPSPVFNGLYLGGGLVYASERAKTNINYTIAAVNGSTNQTESLNGMGVKGFVGYGIFVYENIYLGGELGLGIDRIIGSNKNKVIESGNNVNYSAALRLGYGISNALPYVKFGYEGRPPLKVLNAFNVSRNGYIFGGGLDVSMYVNVFLRAEYMHGFGAKSRISGSGTYMVVPVSAQGKAKTKSDTFLLGAAYKF
jgi:hypothetical protein